MWFLIGAMDIPTDICGVIKRYMTKTVMLMGADKILKGINCLNTNRPIRCPDFPKKALNIHRNLQETLLRWATSCKYLIQDNDQLEVDYTIARFMSYTIDALRYRHNVYVGQGRFYSTSDEVIYGTSDGVLYVLLYGEHPVQLKFSAEDYLSAENFWVVTKYIPQTHQQCAICNTISDHHILLYCPVCTEARTLWKKGFHHEAFEYVRDRYEAYNYVHDHKISPFSLI